ncbi:MAG: transporter [Pirellulales bacterium]
MVLRTLLALLAIPLILTATAFGQEGQGGVTDREGGTEEIETDRDSFTPATSVAGRSRVIYEAAYSFIDNRRVDDTHSYPEFIARMGLTDTIELRVGWNYEVGGAGSPVSGNVPDDFEAEPELERASRILYGGKIWLTSQSGWRPQSSIIVQGFTPTSGKSSSTDFSVTPVVGWQLARGWTWDSGLRYATSSLEDDHFNTWSPSTVLKVPLGERWKAHVEYFGTFSDGRAKETVVQFVSPGVHYLINANTEVGVRAGWGLNDQTPNFFTNVGIGYRY